MGDMLSQEEINALFGGMNNNEEAEEKATEYAPEIPGDLGLEGILDDLQQDVLGEIGNISMGRSATTLSELLNQRVDITTPKVGVIKWSELARAYDRPCVGIRVNYVEGIEGVSVLILKERDVKIISDLMLGGDGLTDPDGEINEIDLSAIAESMNQMIGSSSTSLASIIDSKIDIDTPQAFVLDFNDNNFFESVKFTGDIIACIKFRMEIGDLIDSEIMQIWPIDFAVNLVDQFINVLTGMAERSPAPAPAPEQKAAPPEMPQQQYQQPGMPPPQYQQLEMPQQQYQQPGMPPPQYQQPEMPQQQYQQPGMPPPQYQQPGMPPQGYYPPPGYGYPPQGYAYPPQGYGYPPQPQAKPQPQVNAQPVEFENFDLAQMGYHKENIDIIMDVPLDVTVELGRTTKKIKEILEYRPGSVIELNKLAGEPTDIMVNGKFVARGEVVVMDESFAVRITEIISAEHRI